jgi:hypothetical protein
LREVNAFNRHGNSEKRRRFARQFRRAYRFYRGASQHARIALLFRRQTKREFQRRSNLERNLPVEQMPVRDISRSCPPWNCGGRYDIQTCIGP